MRHSIACIAYEEGKILIAHRNPVGDMGGRWEFPGGKVEKGETDEQSIIREFNEEFGVTVAVGGLIAKGSFIHSGESSTLHAYLIKVPHKGSSIPYRLTEHSEYKWISPEDIPALNFVDSDMSIYPLVMEKLGISSDAEQQ
ncbi:MAG: NUDIX domain-containing protein [Treponema sp.]|jgi:8-oxo-dGTP diphosphatase|nr:NUDIX domain-containing protein [Treponema sp.]